MNWNTFRRKYEFSREIKNEAYERANGKCEICGVETHTQYDHIIPIFAASRLAITPSIVKSLENCQVLCDNCHSEKTWEDEQKDLEDFLWLAQAMFGILD